MMQIKIIFSVGILFLLSGCSFAPKMQTPKVDLPVENEKIALKLDTKWWKEFGDSNLNILIEEALKNNDDLKLAIENVKKGRALYGISEAEMYPKINLGANATRQNGSSNTYQSNGATYNNFSASVSVAYELDFWGRIRDVKNANFASLIATDAQKDAFEISLVSDVATYYFNLISINTQLQIAQETLNSYQESAHFKEMQFKHGVVDELTVAQAKALVASSKTEIVAVQALKVKVQNALVMLLGRTPKEIFENILVTSKELPRPLTIPSGLTASLLQNRPDVMAAEEVLRAKTSLVGVAKAAYFPSVSLTGNFGYQSQTLDNLMQNSSQVWGFGPSINVPLFDFGRIKQAVEVSKSDQKSAVITYEKTVKKAYKEVFEALENIKVVNARYDALKSELKAYNNALELAQKKFDHGTASYLDVLDAQKGVLNTHLLLEDTKFSQLLSQVTLYKALGGGWSIENKKEMRSHADN
jgi:outer membrane protein, multidrug efflux system